MSLLVKITLSAALILSIAVPFGAFAAGEKTKGRYKTALAANVFLFFGTMVFAAVVMFSGNAVAAEEPGQRVHQRQAWGICQRPWPQDFPVWAAASLFPQQPAQHWELSARTAPSWVNH